MLADKIFGASLCVIRTGQGYPITIGNVDIVALFLYNIVCNCVEVMSKVGRA